MLRVVVACSSRVVRPRRRGARLFLLSTSDQTVFAHHNLRTRPSPVRVVGNGVAKSTYAASDPITGYNFMAKYLPVDEANDDCTDQVCSCSGWEITQGRAALSVTAANELGISAGFGLHLVDVAARATSRRTSRRRWVTWRLRRLHGLKYGPLHDRPRPVYRRVRSPGGFAPAGPRQLAPFGAT